MAIDNDHIVDFISNKLFVIFAKSPSTITTNDNAVRSLNTL